MLLTKIREACLPNIAPNSLSELESCDTVENFYTFAKTKLRLHKVHKQLNETRIKSNPKYAHMNGYTGSHHQYNRNNNNKKRNQNNNNYTNNNSNGNSSVPNYIPGHIWATMSSQEKKAHREKYQNRTNNHIRNNIPINMNMTGLASTYQNTNQYNNNEQYSNTPMNLSSSNGPNTNIPMNMSQTTISDLQCMIQSVLNRLNNSPMQNDESS
jgi:hypothetical protein